MKPIYFRVNGIPAWYIWDSDYRDVLEGKGCGPFLTECACRAAIRKFEREK